MEDIKLKKIVALLMATALVFALVGCATGNKDNNAGTNQGDAPGGDQALTLKIWAAQDDQALTRKLADKFIEAHPEYNLTIELGVVGEPDAYKTFSEDPTAAADVFFFPNDQLRDFVSAVGLSEVTRNKDAIISRNIASSIDAATLDGSLWAYPMTADNGFFLYYDKSILSEDDVKSLDRILEVTQAAGKQFHMNVSNSWYIASFFLGAGGSLSIGPDGRQVCDFNNANGLAAAKAIQALTANPAFIDGDDNVLVGGLGGSISAGVSGAWKAEDIEAKLGANYAATKLPTFTLDGKQVQMGSFGGYKLIGVNSTITDPAKLSAAFALADFLSNEESQLLRFEERKMGPSNINAASNPAVQANIALAALAAQNVYATSQNDVLGGYWTPAGAFGTAMVNQTTEDLQSLLDNMVAQIQS